MEMIVGHDKKIAKFVFILNNPDLFSFSLCLLKLASTMNKEPAAA